MEAPDTVYIRQKELRKVVKKVFKVSWLSIDYFSIC